MTDITIFNTNSADIPLDDESVQCVITSPPYWGLRDYGLEPSIWGGDPDCYHDWFQESRPGMTGGTASKKVQVKGAENYSAFPPVKHAYCLECGAWLGQLGLEPTFEEYVDHLVIVFREVRRILRKDGLLFVNLGDSYTGSGGPGSQYDGRAAGKYKENFRKYENPNKKVGNLPPKNLVGIPWRVAFALQEDGWILRSDIIWEKPNCMPESVKDRPTKSHEYVFMFSKSNKYYYDHASIAEPLKQASKERLLRGVSDSNKYAAGVERPAGVHPNTMSQPRPNIRRGHVEGDVPYDHHGQQAHGNEIRLNPKGRNKRTVWSIPTASFKGAHFATFPKSLVRPMIQAGTSEVGCCPGCGKPWKRIIEREFVPQEDVSLDKGIRGSGDQKPMDQSNTWEGFPRGTTATHTIGWEQACNCPPAEPVPCTVFDPFTGSGTVAVVACELDRDFAGCELSPEFIDIAIRRFDEELTEQCPDLAVITPSAVLPPPDPTNETNSSPAAEFAEEIDSCCGLSCSECLKDITTILMS